MPSAGLNIHCQTTPQATNDMENEYRYKVRKTPSNFTFWSMKTASRNPSARAPAMKHRPNRLMLIRAVVQRSLLNRLTYWVRPAQSERGSILELDREMRTVQRMDATYAMSTVAPIGSSAQCAAHAVLRPLRGCFIDRRDAAAALRRQLSTSRSARPLTGSAP